MSSAYIIANVTVTNPQQYEEYKKWSTRRHAGTWGRSLRARRQGRGDRRRLAARPAGDAEVSRRSRRRARFDASPEYGKARAARQGAAIMRMVLVEGV